MSLASDPRLPPFTVQEFSELVCSAFNINDADLHSRLGQPLLSITPASPYSPSLAPSDRIYSPSLLSRVRRREGANPTFSSGMDPQSPLSSPSTPASRSGTITARRMFQQVRTRASAFVLRSRVGPASQSRPTSLLPYEPLPPPCPSPTTSVSSFTRALSPWSMLDLTIQRPASRPPSPARSLLTPTPRPISPPPLPERFAQSYGPSRTRSPTPRLRSFFDDSPAPSRRAYSRPATSPSTKYPLSRVTTTSSVQEALPTESLPSFFDDTGYPVAKSRPPSYCRPATPLGAIHSRLPPLRKAKSGGHGILSRGDRRSNSRSMDTARPVGLGFQDFALWGSRKDKTMPSPLTHPRDPPPVPGGAAALGSGELADPAVALPPAYVYERRGSATSTSTGSTRSSGSLSTRLSNLVGLALPSKMRMRGRSKLNLSIATDSEEASADSSPSTLSSVSPPSTPSSPTPPFARAQAQIYSASVNDPVPQSSGMETEEDELAIGRVLTPDADPFAKADIVLPIHMTPGQLTPISRRASSQGSPSSFNRVVTWDDQDQLHPVKRVRNSLPAPPVSTPQTFPSSCSAHLNDSPGSDASYTFPARLSPSQTPKRHGPPSAWSPLKPDDFPLSEQPTTTSSPPQSPSKSALKRSSQMPPSPARATHVATPGRFPPLFTPPSLPPPNRALPGVPSSSPRAPPLPPKDRRGHVVRGHQSLPPSPPTLYSLTRRGSSHSMAVSDGVSLSTDPLSLAMRACSIKALADRRQVVETEVPPSLGEPWSGTIGNKDGMARPATPILRFQAESRRRSVDSTTTITASPSSSALHDTTRGWDCGTSTASGDESVLNEGDSYSVETFDHSAAASEAELEFWCPRSSQPATFHSARPSFEVGQGRGELSMGIPSAPRDSHRLTGKSTSTGTYA
ncbi:hypothetical protein LXA43DRAFT_893307 [Ganoderma leucocontextum]|nr:hypothetical protein LXA43DRAFT_893307 [Ganoderma leucocontextum]